MARRSSNTQRIGGLSHCVGCGVTQKKEECTPMGTRGVSQCFGCGVVDEGEVDIPKIPNFSAPECPLLRKILFRMRG